MIELDNKYVFHIPVCKYKKKKLVRVDISELIDELIKQLEVKGYTSLYMTDVTGYYKSRSFDELLITIFTSSTSQEKETPNIIFRKWFKDNNDKLKQESFAYEHNNNMIIEELE